MIRNFPAVVSTFVSPHKPNFKPKACKRVSAFPAHVTAFQDGLGFAHAQKKQNIFVFRG